LGGKGKKMLQELLWEEGALKRRKTVLFQEKNELRRPERGWRKGGGDGVERKERKVKEKRYRKWGGERKREEKGKGGGNEGVKGGSRFLLTR